MMALLWPWSVRSPLNPLHAAEYFDTFFEKPWQEMYEGRLIPVPEMPASYLPHLFMLKVPEIMLALGLIGTLGAFAAITRHTVPANRRAAMLIVVLSAIFPVALAMAAHPALYNGLRHFIFVVPPFAALGGFAGVWIAGRARAYGKAALGALAALFIGAVALPVSDMVRLHPYEYTAFNWLSGGVRMAQSNYMLDYWGLAFKQAADELRARLAAGAEHPPQGRRWVVAICGPQSSAQEELGPQFETIFDAKESRLRPGARHFLLPASAGADHGHDRARGRGLCRGLRPARRPDRRSCSPSRRREAGGIWACTHQSRLLSSLLVKSRQTIASKDSTNVRISNRPVRGQALSDYPPLQCRCHSRARASLRNRHQGPSSMGSEDEAEQSNGRPCRPTNGRSKRTSELTSSIVPRGTPFHRWVEVEFSPIAYDPVLLSCGRRRLLPCPAELGAVNPDAVHDHS